MFLDISERIHKDLVKIAPTDNVMKIDCASNHEQYTRVGGFQVCGHLCDFKERIRYDPAKI